MSIEFEHFGKIARLNREVVITEKIDGTNAAVGIKMVTGPNDQEPHATYVQALDQWYEVYAQSRTRVIFPGKDNAGFAQWVWDNAEQLAVELGEGLHFGEWWGQKIQRTYDQTEKHFSLFNTSRWNSAPLTLCKVVPTLAVSGVFNTQNIKEIVADLAGKGSVAAPGYMNPEGVVVFHKHSNQLFKVTTENDEKGKEQ